MEGDVVAGDVICGGDGLGGEDGGGEVVVGVGGEEDVEGEPERAGVFGADQLGEFAEGTRVISHGRPRCAWCGTTRRAWRRRRRDGARTRRRRRVRSRRGK